MALAVAMRQTFCWYRNNTFTKGVAFSHHLMRALSPPSFLLSLFSAVHAFQQRVELLKRQNQDGAEALERREEDKKGGAREMGQVSS